MADALMQVKELRKVFKVRGRTLNKQEFVAVDGVSLTLRAGQTLGLIGESGCGKSTLGRMIARILEPDGGELLLDGVNLLDKGTPFDRHSIQMVFQDPNSALNPGRRIAWILNEALRAKQIDREEDRERIIVQLMPKVGMDADYLRRYPHELSGGQKQRVAILLAILMEPRLIVADEVVSSLDVSVRAQILNLMLDLQRAMGISYLFISHDLDIVYYMSHEIAVMYLGEIVELGGADAVYRDGRHPYTRLLLSSLLDHQSEDSKLVRRAGDITARAKVEGGCPFAARCPKVRERCLRGKPPLLPVGENHFVRCILEIK